jgi:hypothetical protein
MAIYSWFTHSKWWFSTAMLVYQRVIHLERSTQFRTSSISFDKRNQRWVVHPDPWSSHIGAKREFDEPVASLKLQSPQVANITSTADNKLFPTIHIGFIFTYPFPWLTLSPLFPVLSKLAIWYYLAFGFLQKMGPNIFFPTWSAWISHLLSVQEAINGYARPPSAFAGLPVPTAGLLLEPLHPLVSSPCRRAPLGGQIMGIPVIYPLVV